MSQSQEALARSAPSGLTRTDSLLGGAVLARLLLLGLATGNAWHAARASAQDRAHHGEVLWGAKGGRMELQLTVGGVIVAGTVLLALVYTALSGQLN